MQGVQPKARLRNDACSLKTDARRDREGILGSTLKKNINFAFLHLHSKGRRAPPVHVPFGPFLTSVPSLGDDRLLDSARETQPASVGRRISGQLSRQIGNVVCLGLPKIHAHCSISARLEGGTNFLMLSFDTYLLFSLPLSTYSCRGLWNPCPVFVDNALDLVHLIFSRIVQYRISESVLGCRVSAMRDQCSQDLKVTKTHGCMDRPVARKAIRHVEISGLVLF